MLGLVGKTYDEVSSLRLQSIAETLNKRAKNLIYIVRYEDLCTNPNLEQAGMMKFVLDVDDLSGTNMERRLK